MKNRRLFIIFYLICICTTFMFVAAEYSLLQAQETALDLTPANSLDSEEIPWRLVVFSLMLGGLILMFFEIAIIPGFGVTGIAGLILIFASMVFAYLKLSILLGAFVMFFGIASVAFLIYWFTTIFPNTALGKKFVLTTDSNSESVGIAVDDFEHMVGCEGVSATALKPAGKAKIEGERYDVITEGEFIDKDVPIIVKKSSAGRIIVSAKTS